MKKSSFIWSVAAFLVTSSVFVACNKQKAVSGNDSKIKVAAIFQTAIEEPWDGAIHTALLQAAKENDITYEYTEKVDAANYEKVLREYCERGFNLIVGDAFEAGEDPVRKVAKDYPDVQFAFGSEQAEQAPNVSVFDNWIHEPAYLCGVIAGKMTKTGILGVVAAIPIAEVNRLVNAYKAGAQSVNPGIKVKITYIGSFFDPAKAKEAAISQIESGADLIYAERFGVFEAAKEKNILAFGNMTDQNSLAPDTVITSCVWNVYPIIQHELDLIKTGKTESVNLKEYSMYAKGGSFLAPFHQFETSLPADVLKLVKDTESKIADGSLVVPVVETEAVSD
jgi:basic membrane protein A and related proteins